MSEDLDSFIDKFVLKDKRERYRSLLFNKKRRQDGVWDLLHDGRHLDKSKFRSIHNSSMSNMLRIFERMGIVEPVYVLCCDEEYDGNSVPIHDILEMFLGSQSDVLAYDRVSEAGYYENHEGEIYVFSMSPDRATELPNH